jgi:putative flippase GtrA
MDRGTLVALVKFSVVGTLGFFIDAGCLMIVRQAGAGLLSGRVVSFLLAASVTWYCNRRFTFYDRLSNRPTREWASFLAVNSVGGTINYGTYAALVTLIPAFAHHPTLGVAAGSLAGLAFNFSLSWSLVFRSSAGWSRAE